jgi:biopolymer transport protein TolR
MHISAFQKQQRSLKLFSDFNTLQFASVMAIVVFVILIIFMTNPTPFHSYSPDLPKVLHPISMPGANREDAMKITVTRDGKIYLGTEQVDPHTLPQKITDRLKDRGIERKMYIVADSRTYWKNVKRALEGVRAAGVLRVAFMVDQRK